jgi:hypothetical protein
MSRRGDTLTKERSVEGHQLDEKEKQPANRINEGEQVRRCIAGRMDARAYGCEDLIRFHSFHWQLSSH